MSMEDARSRARQDKMETLREIERAHDLDRHSRETLTSLVREQLMDTLGKPADLLSVQVRPLWGANYRANVFVGASIACAKIIHSFFLVTDDEGNILKSTPAVTRRY